MIYKELARLIDYDIPFIEVYNEEGELEYIIDLERVEFTDIEVVYDTTGDYYGVIKLKREYEEA